MRTEAASPCRDAVASCARHAGLAAAIVLLLACGRSSAPVPLSGEIRFTEQTHFSVVADVQRTSLWDHFLYGRESSDAERELLVAEIAARRPGLLVITGDLVADGSSPAQWADFDRLCAPLREKRIPVIAAIGNHEYWRAGRDNLAFFFARFPHLRHQHWYSVGYGPVTLVVLDSNVDVLTTSEWSEQHAWLEQKLAELDRDARVRGVLVLLHHPPYTNSTVTGDEAHVQEAFVPPFARSHKSLAMISGHVHSYERFDRGGKTFIVSGGGAWPRARLSVGKDRRHDDDLFAGPEYRDFHFLDMVPGPGGLDVQVMGVPRGGSTFSRMDAFTLPWPSDDREDASAGGSLPARGDAAPPGR